MAIAVLFSHFCLMIVKTVRGITIYQQIVLRGYFQLLFNLIPMHYSNSHFEPVTHVKYFIMRLFLGGVGYLMFLQGIFQLNMTEAYTVLHLSPLMTMLMGVAVLGEKVTAQDLLQSALALGGVMLVIKPAFLFPPLSE